MAEATKKTYRWTQYGERRHADARVAGSLASPNLTANARRTLNSKGTIASTTAINASGGTVNFPQTGNRHIGPLGGRPSASAETAGEDRRVAVPADADDADRRGHGFTDASSSSTDEQRGDSQRHGRCDRGAERSTAGNINTKSRGGGRVDCSRVRRATLRFTLLGETNLDARST